jgi:putative phosphoribosyl transferase
MRQPRPGENVIEDPKLRDREWVFQDLGDGGRVLAELLRTLELARPFVLAIPSGGVPVGLVVAQTLGADMDIVIARKLQIPGNPEAGFGSTVTDGPLWLNQDLVERLGLGPQAIAAAERKTREELRRREALFRGRRPAPQLADLDVIIVDDGIASGFTMKAAAVWAQDQRPHLLILAAPTGHLESVTSLARGADSLVCPNIRANSSFAVANAYRNWYDLGDDEVTDLLTRQNSASPEG